MPPSCQRRRASPTERPLGATVTGVHGHVGEQLDRVESGIRTREREWRECAHAPPPPFRTRPSSPETGHPSAQARYRGSAIAINPGVRLDQAEALHLQSYRAGSPRTGAVLAPSDSGASTNCWTVAMGCAAGCCRRLGSIFGLHEVSRPFPDLAVRHRPIASGRTWSQQLVVTNDIKFVVSVIQHVG
jgi:hypothetical protein